MTYPGCVLERTEYAWRLFNRGLQQIDSIVSTVRDTVPSTVRDLVQNFAEFTITLIFSLMNLYS